MKITAEKEDLILKKIKGKLTRWSFMANSLRTMQIVLGFLAIISSLFVAAKLDCQVDKGILEWAALIAAISVGIQTGFNLGQKCNRIRTAWRNLHAGIMRYEIDDSYTIINLLDLYKSGEDLIGDVSDVIR